MKTIRGFFTSITLVLTMVVAGGAYADPTVVGGNIIIDREFSDGFSNFSVLDLNNPFNADGMLNRWEVFAKKENDIQLVIYRQEGGEFFVVGRSEVETPVTGYNLFDLGKKKIKVKAGDFIGVYSPGEGSVAYSNTDNFLDLSGTAMFTGDNSGGEDEEITMFIRSSIRSYSVRAMGGPK